MLHQQLRGIKEPRPDTQRRIIKAAGKLFADSGYGHTTIRAICAHAGVNVAAVNYHFGGKKNLYLTVLRDLHARALAEHPFDLDDRSTGSPAERLTGFIRAFLFRVLDEGDGTRFAKIMARELIQPTDALDELIKNIINPAFAFLSATVRQLLKKTVSEEKVALCCLSIAGQVFYFYMTRHVIRKLFDRERFETGEIEAIATHMARFSLYAIDRMARADEVEIK
jgi:AcrR family transcriptional regulator